MHKRYRHSDGTSPMPSVRLPPTSFCDFHKVVPSCWLSNSAGFTAGSSSVEVSYSCRIGLASNLSCKLFNIDTVGYINSKRNQSVCIHHKGCWHIWTNEFFESLGRSTGIATAGATSRSRELPTWTGDCWLSLVIRRHISPDSDELPAGPVADYNNFDYSNFHVIANTAGYPAPGSHCANASFAVALSRFGWGMSRYAYFEFG